MIKEFINEAGNSRPKTPDMIMYEKLEKMGVDFGKMPFQEWESSGEIPKDFKIKNEWKKGFKHQGDLYKNKYSKASRLKQKMESIKNGKLPKYRFCNICEEVCKTEKTKISYGELRKRIYICEKCNTKEFQEKNSIIKNNSKEENKRYKEKIMKKVACSFILLCLRDNTTNAGDKSRIAKNLIVEKNNNYAKEYYKKNRNKIDIKAKRKRRKIKIAKEQEHNEKYLKR